LELQKEELNNKNEELNEVNNTKDKFFSILAHDLKNPFGALIGYTSLLLDEIEILDKTEIKDIVEKTNSVSNNSFQLLENLLSWARSQTGVLTINHKEIELSNLINETTTLFHDIAVSKNININCNLNEKVVINSDEDILRTIFRNVISNAIKFSYQKSKIDITLFKQNGNAVFEIQDYGMGMDAETLDSLFRIDVNISNLGTNNEKGTGLGLILTNEFVQKINGKISVESHLDKGSKFTILLPLNN
jgi:signal transduction histidine kinase